MDERQLDRLVASIDALTSAVRGLSLNPTHPTGGIEIVQPGAASPASWESSAHSPSVQEMVDRYLAERRASGEWGDAYERTSTHWLEHLAVFFGPDKPIRMIDRNEMLRYRQHLVESPVKNGKERRASSTVNTILIHLGAFFRWCRDTAEVLDKDPTVKLKLKTGGKTRAPLTLDEIEKVWTGMWQDAPTPAHFWLPTICLYTGMRREEAAQLRVGDVKPLPDTSHDFFDLREHEKLKTSASARAVPAHHALWELGLAELIERRPKGELIFGEWCPVRSDGLRGAAISSWFNARLRRMKIPKSKVFHSTRHTVATQLKQLGAEDYIIAQILGHENSNITTGHYGHDVDLGPLNEWIQRMEFPTKS